MILRKYTPEDLPELAELFYNTVHSICTKDYNPAQINAWADGNIDTDKWNSSFAELYTLVAVSDNKIVGFGNIDKSGYLDMLYVHKDYQNKGVATAICNALEKYVNTLEYTVYASKTALGFFEKRGYAVIRKNTVVRHNISIVNYYMKKRINS